MSKLSTRHRVRSSQGEVRPFEGMRQVNPHAAGVDIGAHEIVACVPDGDAQQIVRTFGTYTADLQALADWFVDRGIETVAMESTGVYWIPLFEELAACGFHCCLISAQSIKRVPGRKSDVLDCQWTRLSTVTGCCRPRFGLTLTSSRCERCCAIGPNASSIALPMSSTCKRRSCR